MSSPATPTPLETLSARERPGTYWLPAQPVLLDAHALLWWLLDDPQLSDPARAAISDAKRRVCVSAASAWEIAIKHQIGKLPEAGDIVANLESYIRKERFEVLPMGLNHALAAGKLPGPHRDPFDRMLMAQATAESMVLVSNDRVFRDYGVTVLW